MKPKLILASASPRRGDILNALGFNFTQMTVDVDEGNQDNLTPEKYAIETAKKKAMAAIKTEPKSIIIAADTIVLLVDGTVLGKPSNSKAAVKMLAQLQGTSHIVITAIAIVNGLQNKVLAAYDKTKVTFMPMTRDEIDWYVSTGEPMDKAGAYGLQEKGMLFVKKVDGSASNVIGLPTHLLYQLFRSSGLNIFDYIQTLRQNNK